MKRAVRIIVRGTVQGVFFRQFVKEHADKLGITGFVRNLENNDTLRDSKGNLLGAHCVEIVAEAEKEKLDSLIGHVQKGPEHAQIRNVDVEERKWSDSFKDFQILRF